MKLCMKANAPTICTENCRDCAKDEYHKLKDLAGKAELVPEQAIRNDIGDAEFDMLRHYNLIEHCRVDEKGQHWYAI